MDCLLYRVPCNECVRVIRWIIFSLYYFFSLLRAYPYLVAILVTSYIRMNVCACMYAGDRQLWECNVSQQLRECIPDRHSRRCACMHMYVHGAQPIQSHSCYLPFHWCPQKPSYSNTLFHFLVSHPTYLTWTDHHPSTYIPIFYLHHTTY